MCKNQEYNNAHFVIIYIYFYSRDTTFVKINGDNPYKELGTVSLECKVL
jgi:hypothetical protein